jgi:CDP-glucose 4,6-dehydratase
VRALQAGQPIPVRNPAATRPWQHVLEPLGGYLTLAAQLFAPDKVVDSAFNFGPAHESNRPVADLVRAILQTWPGQWQDCSDPDAPHEAHQLHLATDKAFRLLDWSPRWTFEQAIGHTIEWYRTASQFPAGDHQRFIDLTRGQIEQFTRASGLPA